MVDLARQAFTSKHFDLAAEIYERSISENGPKTELLLGLADSFAKGGHFEKAFTAYSKAFRVGSISPKDLKHLVAALVYSVKQESPLESEMIKNLMFDCQYCRNIVDDPVTITCGHTFCRSCLVKDASKQCKTCGVVNHYLHVSKIKSNILLSRTVEKWFPEHCKAVRLKKKANTSFQACKFEEAITLYSEAMNVVPGDHLLWSNRSHAYARLDRFREALEDADTVLKLRPDWPKGYFRRGCALYGLCRYEESVVALLQCLALDSSIDTAKEYLSNALHNILSPLSPDDPKSVELQRQLNPSLLDRLICSNFDSSLLLPSITVDAVRQLKEIITDTVATATTFLEGHTSGTTACKDKQTEDQQQVPTSSWERDHTSANCDTRSTSRSASPSPSRGSRANSDASSQSYGAEYVANQSCESEDHAMSTSVGQPVTNQKPDAKLNVNIPYVDPNLIDKDEFECSLCYRLLHQPVTTPCGHMFCRQCLDRVLDHKTECPLCKSNLSEYLAERRQSITSAMEKLLEVYLPEEHEQRRLQHEEEIAELASMGRDTQHEIPVFVCTLAYPFVPCPLHIFEPRYRLMIRQCMESGRRQFGMCIATGERQEDFSEYGCMLEIRDVQFFPDGRSVVDTIGGKRFKVISRGHREGYCTAKVEYLQDAPADNAAELKALSENVFAVCQTWVNSLSLVQKQQIEPHLVNAKTEGNYGINGTAWHWWMISVLPLDPRIQLAMVAMTSYKERLQGLNKVLGYIMNKHSSR